jgi:hypothetical protein
MYGFIDFLREDSYNSYFFYQIKIYHSCCFCYSLLKKLQSGWKIISLWDIWKRFWGFVKRFWGGYELQKKMSVYQYMSRNIDNNKNNKKIMDSRINI